MSEPYLKTVIPASWPNRLALPPLQAFTTTAKTSFDQLRLPSAPHWLVQEHGIESICLDDWREGIVADAAWTDQPHQVIAIKTADCLPILLASSTSPLVAGIHAGWRGLAQGVIQHTLERLPVDNSALQAWIGPAISAPQYEVDALVFKAFTDLDPDLAVFFESHRADRWRANLVGIAKHQLQELGVAGIVSSGLCTASDPERLFSYRRGLPKNQETARMASLIWLE